MFPPAWLNFSSSTCFFSCRANAWYFWSKLPSRAAKDAAEIDLADAQTNETTWSNPHQSSSGTGDATTVPGVRADLPAAATSREKEEEGGLPPIDPDLAWLDPSAARVGAARAVTQTARFNARTGRFQADPSRNPDRISDFQRGQRQQEAYYDGTQALQIPCCSCLDSGPLFP